MRDITEQTTSDSLIDFSRFSHEDKSRKTKKTNVFKVLFKKNKAFDLASEPEEHKTVDAEAKKISERFAMTHSILWVVLIAFVVIFFIFFGDGITTGSMQHMFRNMLGRGDVTDGASEYYFTVNENATFADFGGVPVMAGSDRVVIFAPDGSHQYSDESAYAVPQIKTSKQYILIYDKNGSAYGIYDEFGVRHIDTEGERIYTGALADDGTYVVARKGKEYSSEISIYTSGFELLNLIRKNNRVASVDIRPDGSEIMVLSYSVLANGSIESELMLLGKNDTAPRKLLSFTRGLPLECKYLDGGEIILLFDDTVSVLNSGGDVLSSCAVDISATHRYTFTDSGALMYTTRVREDSDVFDFNYVKLDKNGLKKSSCRVEDRVVGLNMYGDYAYIITEHSVIRFTAPDASQTQIYRSHRRIYSFVAVSGREYVCFSDTMTEIGFDDNDKQ